MRKKEFEKLLARYNKGLCTPDEEAYIDEWFSAMEDDVPVDGADRALIKRRSWDRLRRYMTESKDDREQERKAGNGQRIGAYSRFGLPLAASILILLGALAYLVVNGLENGVPAEETLLSERRVYNGTEKVMRIFLDDGSEVLLKPRSSLQYKEGFDKTQRALFLEGEAFFIVSRDSLRPFLVTTDHLVTKVLGTSFLVSAFSNQPNVTVEVKSGKVSVTTKKNVLQRPGAEGEMILTPNQRVSYNTVNNQMSRGIIEKPQPILPAEEIDRMYFEAAPVGEIFEGLERAYGVDIQFDKDIFSSCVLTTSIGEGSIHNRLDMICRAIDATYVFKEDRIVIRGAGCNR
jgi:transmembrane sensor